MNCPKRQAKDFWFKAILAIFLVFALFGLIVSTYAEKIYLDINQPQIKKLSIALEGFDKVLTVSNTIREDLEFTDYFKVYGPFPYKGENFEPSLWKNADVEIVIRADTVDKISMKIYTVTMESPIFAKDYALQNNENTGHAIASDIYKILTGRESPFFNRFVFLRKFKGSMGIFISNWNGKIIQDTGIRREIISRAVLKGDKILYSSLQNRFWHIELFDVSTKINKEIIKSKALLQLGDMIDNSQFIYLYNDGEVSEIKISNLEGKSKSVLSSRWIDSSPRWYRNQIFFVSNRAGSPQIYQSYEGAIPRRITFQGHYNTEPSISPDGGKLIFSSLVGGFQLYVLDLISGKQIQITNDGNNEQPSFCPDGHFVIAMSDRRGKREIYIISSDGLIQKHLTTGYLPYCTR